METNKYDDEDDDIMASKTISDIDNNNDNDESGNNLIPVLPSIKLSTEAHIKDIEKLKENTSDLLDPAWKEQRNRQLIGKMLELEEPAVTPKMVDFMVQDGVCEAMLAYVTRLNTGQERY